MKVITAEIPILSDSEKIKFESNVSANGDGECRDWTGSFDKYGYGKTFIKGKTRFAHRVSYFIFTGIDPIGLCCLHRCDRPSCVNPLHLFLGDHKDNTSDKVLKGRQLKWERNAGAKLSKNDVIRIREMHKSGGLTYRALAIQFGLSATQIGRIVKNERWIFP